MSASRNTGTSPSMSSSAFNAKAAALSERLGPITKPEKRAQAPRQPWKRPMGKPETPETSEASETLEASETSEASETPEKSES